MPEMRMDINELIPLSLNPQGAKAVGFPESSVAVGGCLWRCVRAVDFSLCNHLNTLSSSALPGRRIFLNVLVAKTCGSIWARDLNRGLFCLDREPLALVGIHSLDAKIRDLISVPRCLKTYFAFQRLIVG